MRFLSILFPFLLCIASLTTSFGEETATEIVAARELIRGRLAANDARLDEAARSSIRELHESEAHQDMALLAKCLRFAEHPVNRMSSDQASYYFPVRSLCGSTPHAAYFVREFSSNSSLAYKLLIAAEIMSYRMTSDRIDEIRNFYVQLRKDPTAGDLGVQEDLDELLYVVSELQDRSGKGPILNWKVIYSHTGSEYPLDPVSRDALHRRLPKWKWLKANVPKPSQEEILAYLKEMNPQAYELHIFKQKKPAPVLAESAVAEHSFWRTGFLWWAFGGVVLIGLGAWFWRGRRA